jgi:drug/metabolite transporter (DMT)-like permease
MILSRSAGRWRPLALLAGFGILMGAIPPMAKLAAAAGLSPITFALFQAAGGGLVILGVCAARRQRLPLDKRHLRYYGLAGFISVALPNWLAYLTVPHLGAGLTGLAYAFPPLFTMGLAALVGVERIMPRRATGIVLGFAGALAIALPDQALPPAVNPAWLLPAFAVPLCLAIGNVYRSHDWPAGTPPFPLAAGMLLAAGLELLIPWAATGAPLPPAGETWLVLASIGITGLAYMMFLELQRVAGPVYLSQAGFLITLTGLAVGGTLFGEHYSAWVWAAVALVFTGVALTNSGRVKAIAGPRMSTD